MDRELRLVEVEDTVHMTARASGGSVMVSLALNQFMAPNEASVQMNAKDGSVRINWHEQRYGTMRQGETEWQWGETLIHDRDDLFRLQAQHMVEACRGKASVLCSLEEAIQTFKVNQAALASAGERVVKIE